MHTKGEIILQNKDTVSIWAVLPIFLVLGVLIIGAFTFAGWSIMQMRDNARTAVLSLGKGAQVAEAPAAAADYYAEVLPEEYAFTIEVFGQLVSFGENHPTPVDYRMFVPVRGVFEALGYVETWDEQTNVAMFTDGTNTVVITMDGYEFTANGEEHSLDSPARFIDDVAMFPLEPIIQSLGYDLTFNYESNTIQISHRPAPTPQPTPEPTPQPTPAPAAVRRPAPTPTPTVPCVICNDTHLTICGSCNGIGGGRGVSPFIPGIPYAVSPSADVWWCTTCEGRGTVRCHAC